MAGTVLVESGLVFGDIVVSVFVAGAVFGDIGVSLTFGGRHSVRLGWVLPLLLVFLAA